VGIGVVLWWLPWQRWHRLATLASIAPGFALISVADMIDPNPYGYGLFYVVVFLWIGLVHRRGMSLIGLPPVTIAYLAPLALTGAITDAATSGLVYTAGVCVMAGEVVAAVSDHLRRAQQALARRESQARFEALVKHSSDLISIVGQDGQLGYV